MAVFWRLMALMKKELILLLKNPKTRITLFLPTFIQLVILAYAATMDLKCVDFAVLDHDRTVDSREMAAAFTHNGIFIRKVDFLSEQEMADRIARRDVKMGLVIPDHFSRDFRRGMSPVVQVIADGRNSSTAGLIQAYAATVVQGFNQKEIPGNSGMPTIKPRAWFNPNYSAQYFMVPALLANIALLNLIMLSAMTLAREREDGTFDQLLLTPYSSFELLFVKGVSTGFVGMVQLTFGYLLAVYWFEIPFYGNIVLLYILFLAFLYASVGIGLLLSVFSMDLNQAMMGTILVAIPFSTLSGFATPIESMPEILQQITLINPVRYGIKALQRIFLEGVSVMELLPTFGVLFLIGTVTLVIAHITFVRQRRS